jgi:hypothetical protein
LLIRETANGPDDHAIVAALNNLAILLQDQGELAAAQQAFERALATAEKTFGHAIQNTHRLRRNLARLLIAADCPAEALALAEPALAAHELALGPDHLWTKESAATTADALDRLGRANEAAALRARHGGERDHH